MDFRVFMNLFTFFESFKQGENETEKIQLVSTTKEPFFQVQLPEVLNYNGEDCRGNLGCFPTSSPWWAVERPVSLAPNSIEGIGPFFCYYSKLHPQCKKIKPTKECKTKNIDVTEETSLIFITHGFLHSTETPWVKSLVASLVNNLESNIRVMALDWENGATPPYAQAVANTRLMGAVVGRFLQCLVKRNGLRISHTHLIGHSLGAHLFGYSGNYLFRSDNRSQVGRITGLDPAGPYFLGTSSEVHLDYNDAFLVDIFHTDSTSFIPTFPVSLGLPKASGHFDFFPNGGGQQKGCHTIPKGNMLVKKGIRKGVLDYIGCSHERAHGYLTSAISKRCNYIGVECTSWDDFKEGKCWDCETLRCFKMGIDLQRVYPEGSKVKRESFYHVISKGQNRIPLYLATTDDETVCGVQYRFTLKVSNSNASQNQGGEYAKFKIIIRGENGSSETVPKSKVYAPGDVIHWVDAIPQSIGNITSLVITYEEQTTVLQQLFWRLSTPTLYMEELILEGLLNTERKIFYFCGEKLSLDQTMILKQKCQEEEEEPKTPEKEAVSTSLFNIF